MEKPRHCSIGQAAAGGKVVERTSGPRATRTSHTCFTVKRVPWSSVMSGGTWSEWAAQAVWKPPERGLDRASVGRKGHCVTRACVASGQGRYLAFESRRDPTLSACRQVAGWPSRETIGTCGSGRSWGSLGRWLQTQSLPGPHGGVTHGQWYQHEVSLSETG